MIEIKLISDNATKNSDIAKAFEKMDFEKRRFFERECETIDWAVAFQNNHACAYLGVANCRGTSVFTHIITEQTVEEPAVFKMLTNSFNSAVLPMDIQTAENEEEANKKMARNNAIAIYSMFVEPVK